MITTTFRQVQPILPSMDVSMSIRFYVDKLGFELAFQDDPQSPSYAGVRRDEVELHLQWHDEREWQAVERPMLRFVIKDVEVLFKEYSTKGVFHQNTSIRKTAWGTKEFAFYDLYGNGLTFYENLS